MTTLLVSALVCKRGPKRTVDGISFETESGSVLSLLGPNGAGKTTTLKAIAGVFRQSAGEIKIVRSKETARRNPRVALIPELPKVYGLLTIWEHMEFVARSCNVDDNWKERATTLLHALDLFDRRDSLGHDLSKGMKQKTLIAATLLSEADVFLFDEPTVGLDISAQVEIAKLITEISRSSAVVVSTHQVDLASTISNRVIVMRNGRIAGEGTVPLQDPLASREFIKALYAEAMS